MNPAHFQELASLFDAAAAGADKCRRADVESLVSFDRSPPAFLSEEGIAAFALVRVCLERSLHEGEETIPGEVAGYPILGVLGSGGWGVVYRARQLSPVREVALKVLRRDFPCDDAPRRFAFEAEALAALNHPGIAQIYDAGTWSDEGLMRFYLAMELVNGPSLTRFGRDHALSVPQRLALFLELCDAVQHAHQNGVIHRDLKPGNILVAPDGQPKIVDFGIARRSRAEIELTLQQTRPGELLGTLPYMSPEQFTSTVASVDTRTDVYALGVVLFEFLTGKLPFDLEGQGIADAARTICEHPPRRLREVDPSIAGDLGTVVEKAIAKDPSRRYQSAQELATDIRRFLENRPIEARPASVMYRLRKFAGRNRALTGAVVAAAFAVAVATVGMTVLAIAAKNAERRAQRRFDEVRELARAFLFDTYERLGDVEGSLDTRHFIVSTGLRYLDSLSADATGDPTLLLELAAGYTRLGDVQGNRLHAGNLGDHAGAMESYAKAENLLHPAPPSPSRDTILAGVLESRAALVCDIQEPRQAIREIEQAVLIRERLAAGTEAGTAERRAFHAALELRVAVARYFTMNTPPARQDMEYAESCERAANAYAATLDPEERMDPWRFAHLTRNPGNALRRGARPGSIQPDQLPVEEARRKVETYKQRAVAQPESADAQTTYFESLMLLGRMLIMKGDSEAADIYGEAARIADARRARAPLDLDARVMAHHAHAGRSESLLKQGRNEEALSAAQTAHEIASGVAGERQQRGALGLVISALVRMERVDEARVAAREWLDVGNARGPDIVVPVAELAALVLRVEIDDAAACAEAGSLCNKALEAMAAAAAEGHRRPPSREALHGRLGAISDACARGDRAGAMRAAQCSATDP